MRYLIAILISCLSLDAATYYIDYDTGDDTNAGTSSAAPWKHCPGDPRATSNASVTLSLGDEVVFKGGVSYLLDSGGGGGYIDANQHQLTFKSGHIADPQWGTSMAIINGTNAANSGAINGVLNLTKTNITVDSICFLGLEYQDSYAAAIYSASSGLDANLLVQNCVFSNIVESAIYIPGQYTSGFNSDYTITNCAFHNIGTHGVFFRWGITNAQVLNNTFTNIGWRSDSPGPGGDPVAVFGNDSPTWHSGLIVRGNVSYGVPIKSFIILSDQNENVLIEKNWIGGTNGFAGMDFNGAGTNITVRNNVFDMVVGNFYGPIVVDTDQGTGIMVDGLNIYNNTFSSATPNIGQIFLGKGNSPDAQTSKNVDIRNNILLSQTASRSIVYVETSATGAAASDVATLTIDYNAADFNGYSTPYHLQGTNYTFAGWQAIGFDVNSNEGTPTFSSGWELSGADTIALDQGVDLSGTFTDDYNGNTRSGTWDIGAFEFQPAGANDATVSGAIRF